MSENIGNFSGSLGMDSSGMVAGMSRAGQAAKAAAGDLSILSGQLNGMAGAGNGFTESQERLSKTMELMSLRHVEMQQRMSGMYQMMARNTKAAKEYAVAVKNVATLAPDAMSGHMASRAAFESKMSSSGNKKDGTSGEMIIEMASQHAAMEATKQKQQSITEEIRRRSHQMRSVTAQEQELVKVMAEEVSLQANLLSLKSKLTATLANEVAAKKLVDRDTSNNFAAEREAAADRRLAERQSQSAMIERLARQEANAEKAAINEVAAAREAAADRRQKERLDNAEMLASALDQEKRAKRAAADSDASEREAAADKRHREAQEQAAMLDRLAKQEAAARKQIDTAVASASAQKSSLMERRQDSNTAIRDAGRDTGSKSSTEHAADAKKQTTELAAQQKLVNSLVAERTRLAALGKSDLDIERKITSETEKEFILRERLAQTKAEGLSATKMESKGLAEANNILAQLGSKTANEARIVAQVALNAEQFAAAMMRAKTAGLPTADIARLSAEFAKLNTLQNASNQLSQGRGMGNLGFAFQQAAFGVEDFASQIQNGLIPALSGAGNNINMIAMMLGGPVVQGISVAIIASIQFAKAFGLIGAEAKKTDTQLEDAAAAAKMFATTLADLKESQSRALESPDLKSLEDVLARRRELFEEARKIETEQGEINKAARVKQLKEQLAEEESYANKAKILFGIVANNATLENGFDFGKTADEAWGAHQQAIDDLRENLRALGAEMTEEQRKQQEIYARIINYNKEIIAAEKQRLAIQAKQSQQMNSPELIDPVDKRSASTLIDDHKKHQDEFNASIEREAEATARIRTLAKEMATTEELRMKYMKENADLHMVLAEEEKKQLDMAVKISAELELRKKLHDDAVDAAKTINELNQSMQASGNAAAESWMAASDEFKKFADELDKIQKNSRFKKGEVGFEAEARSSLATNARSLEQRRKNELQERNDSLELKPEIHANLADSVFRESQARQALEAARMSLAISQANGNLDQQKDKLREVYEAQQKLTDAATKTADAQREVNSRLNEIAGGGRGSIDSLSEESAFIDRMKKQREEINRAEIQQQERINEMQAQGSSAQDIAQARLANRKLIDQARLAQKAEEDLRVSDRAIADLEAAKQFFTGKLSEATGDFHTSQVADRGSAEALKIIDDSRAQNSKAKEQQPIIDKIIETNSLLREQNRIREEKYDQYSTNWEAVNI